MINNNLIILSHINLILIHEQVTNYRGNLIKLKPEDYLIELNSQNYFTVESNFNLHLKYQISALQS